MKSGLGVDMFEVTRLTREGRLDEAMDMLRGLSGAGERPPTGDPVKSPSDGLATTMEFVPGRDGAGTWTLPSAAARDDIDIGRFRPGPMQGLAGLMEHWPKPGRAGRAKPGATVVVPAGAVFEERTFSNGHGSCAYKLYVPSSFTGQALPLIVMLHGCTQTPDDFAIGTRMNDLAEEHGFLVAYPAQSQASNPSRCWNWFAGAHQRRGEGEPALIAGLTQQVMQDFPVQPGKVFIAGLSAGGAAAAVLGDVYPDLFAAVGVHSGLACGAATDMASAFGAMRNGAMPARPGRGSPKRTVPTIVFHGDQDSTVNPINGEQVIDRAQGGRHLRRNVIKGRSPSGVGYTRTTTETASGDTVLEHWLIHGGAHAWSGGHQQGSFTAPDGPDASREMVRFFLAQG